MAHPKAWVSWSGSCLSGALLSGPASVSCRVPTMGPRRLPPLGFSGRLLIHFPICSFRTQDAVSLTWCREPCV